MDFCPAHSLLEAEASVKGLPLNPSPPLPSTPPLLSPQPLPSSPLNPSPPLPSLLHHDIFQCKLLEMFPEEAGEEDPAQRMIPFLPGGWMHKRARADAPPRMTCLQPGRSSFGPHMHAFYIHQLIRSVPMLCLLLFFVVSVCLCVADW